MVKSTRVGRPSPSFQDRILRRRIQSSKLHLDTDAATLAEHLRSLYPDYNRIKLQPFTRRVHQTILHLQNSHPQQQTEEGTVEDGQRSHLSEENPLHRKRKKKDISPSSDSSSSTSSSGKEDAIFDAKVEPEFDITKSMLREKYGKSPKSKEKDEGRTIMEVENSVDRPKVRILESANRNVIEETPATSMWAGGHGAELGKVEDSDGPRFTDFGGIEAVLEELLMEVIVPLCHPQLPRWLGVRPMAGILLHGPPGCGKTRLAHAIANETGVPFYKISATEVVSGVSGQSEGNIRDLFRKAYRTAPSIVFIDEIDAIASKRENLQREMERRIVTQLMTCMDESHQTLKSGDADSDSETSEKKPGYVLVIGATNRPDAVDSALRRPGRFDREIVLGVPDENARKEILSVLTLKLRVEGTFDLLKIARSTPGFVGADLTALVNKAGNLAMRRIIDRRKSGFLGEKKRDENTKEWWRQPWEPDEMEKLCITMADFEEAVKLVQPSLRREGFSSIPNVKWDDVGGLGSLRKEFDRYIVQHIKYPEFYKEIGVTSEAGFLLYGPPGCGKTLIAKAVANEAGANFIHIKGPELLNKYVGESELAVRTIFSRARTCSPCILFFDEVDALTTKRGKEGGWVVERLLNQLLIELDGADERHGVYVIGATNRLEVVDPAVLRPGRLGKVMYVPLPSAEERVLILKALGRKKRLATDVDLDAIGQSEACHNLSGADLAEVMKEAAMAVVEEKLMAIRQENPNTEPWLIKACHFEQALRKVSPSVSEKERMYYKALSQNFRAARETHPSTENPSFLC